MTATGVSETSRRERTDLRYLRAWVGPTPAVVSGLEPAPEPAYLQLAVILRARIAKGGWRNGPWRSVKQLQHDHDAGRDTVLRSIETPSVKTTAPHHYLGPHLRRPDEGVAGRRSHHAIQRSATQTGCPARNKIWLVAGRASVPQVACSYSFIRPLRTGFRRICCVSMSVRWRVGTSVHG